ncbi:carboxymuconolactone decarboxylase family protein [Taibaiella koreensis]|uniref:carboxymuconolactone decarboxylase family protein n=1 Tax=Taibaiella koreensis TaxID=1268548 RepID=UPI000E59F7F1|nr:carboxymuconolactone decarboxylase family protein [Taibaiella koreensis]
MRQRINALEKGPGAMKALFGLGNYLAKSSLDQEMLDLICFRVSQINGCAFCLDMHAKDLRAKGESEQRLYLLNAWREAPFYSEREQAALAWAEAVTRITGGDVPDDVYLMVRKQFSEEELVDLTIAVTTINTYNRINIAFRVQAGSYVPGQFASAQ